MSAFRFQDRYVDSLNSFQLFVEEKITFDAKSPCTHYRTIRMFQKVLKVYINISLLHTINKQLDYVKCPYFAKKCCL